MVLEKICESGKMNVVEKAAGCVVRRLLDSDRDTFAYGELFVLEKGNLHRTL